MGTKTIALIASAACKATDTTCKRWFYLRQWVTEYKELLRYYRILATDGTADIICQVAPTLDVDTLGPTTRGVVELTTRVSRAEVDRVFFFQDPRDLGMDRPENRELLRCCSEYGVGLYFNGAAALWAEYEDSDKKCSAGRPDHSTSAGTLVLISHDGKKSEMAEFVLRSAKILKQFKVLATTGTRAMLIPLLRAAGHDDLRIEAVGASVKFPDGVRGGAHIVANMVYRKECSNLLFLIDHWPEARENGADVQLLLSAAVDPELDVNLMLSRAMAEEWIGRYK